MSNTKNTIKRDTLIEASAEQLERMRSDLRRKLARLQSEEEDLYSCLDDIRSELADRVEGCGECGDCDACMVHADEH